MWSRLGNWALRHGTRVAVNQLTAVGNAALSRRSIYRQVFSVTLPVTVYVYAAHSRVVVRREAQNRVDLEARMRGAFGITLSVEQDDAGVYVIARRKPVAGGLSRIDFTLIVPPEARILAQLTPGELVLEDVDGTLEALPIRGSPDTNRAIP